MIIMFLRRSEILEISVMFFVFIFSVVENGVRMELE